MSEDIYDPVANVNAGIAYMCGRLGIDVPPPLTREQMVGDIATAYNYFEV